jgi:hypothetical protein
MRTAHAAMQSAHVLQTLMSQSVIMHPMVPAPSWMLAMMVVPLAASIKMIGIPVYHQQLISTKGFLHR